MNYDILAREVQKYINDNLTTDIHSILLKKSPFPNVSSKELVEQIESKVKSRQKLPTWFSTKNIYFPNKLNLSQTSSEITARYKATLVNGNTLADLTGGFGVDCFAFSKKMKHVLCVEKNEELCAIARYNYKQMNVLNADFVRGDGIQVLKDSNKVYDWLYIDPSRRDTKNNKVYYLSDCEPDITAQIDFLFNKSNNILIKTGPLLDLSLGLKQLTNVKEIHIIAVSNDVKEVLWILERNFKNEPLIKTINFKSGITQNFEFKISEEHAAKPTFSMPNEFLYEPNAAILKSGAFQYIGTYFSLTKSHPNSHLYSSSSLIAFPGRIF